MITNTLANWPAPSFIKALTTQRLNGCSSYPYAEEFSIPCRRRGTHVEKKSFKRFIKI